MLAAASTLAVPAGAAVAAPEPGQYVPVAPVTVVNNVRLAAGGTTTATVTGVGGVPPAAGVAAVAVNVIANQPAGTGHLQVYPAGPSRPVDSTLNFSKGRTTAGHEVVPVSASGRITIFTPTATRVVVRLRGWYAPAPGPSGADWAQDRNGPTHSGTNPAEAVLTATAVRGLGQAWSAAVGESHGGAAVVDDVVYVNSSGRVRALDTATGATRWTGALAGAIRSASAVAGGALYVGSADGRLFALDAAAGTPRWNALVGFTAVAAPTVADGTVFVRSHDGRAHAFDAATGAARWTTIIGGNPMFGQGPSPAPPTVADGVVYVAGPHNGRPYALDTATGAVVWDVTAGSSVRGVALATGSSTRPGPWGSAPPSFAPWTPPPAPPCGRSAAPRT